MGFLTGKRVLIVGVASKLSIASGIAAAMHREGAELAFTYQNEKLKGRVEDFAAGWGSSADLCFPCDVASDEEIAAVFEALSKKWDGLDCIVHSVGFAPGDQRTATSPTSPPVKASRSPTTSAPTASSPWPRPVAR